MSSKRNRSNRPSTSEAGQRQSMRATETAVNVRPASPVPDPLITEERIREAAYLLAARRGFAPGHELDDWLEAQRTIYGATGEPSAANSSARKGRGLGEVG